jgi:type II secretion system protein N
MAVRGLSLPSFAGGFVNILRRPVVYYGLYTFVLFLVFIIVTFPHEVLVRRALDMVQSNSVSVTIDGANFAWWNGYELDGLKLTALPLKEGSPPLIEWSRLQLRPNYRSLLKGKLESVALWGELYGGTADGIFTLTQTSPPAVNAHVEWSGLEIRRYRALTTWLDEGRLSGTLGGWFDAEATNGTPPQGEGEIFLQRAGLAGGKIMGFTVPDLSIEDAKSKFTLKGDRLELQDVTLTGNEISLQLKGFITLREPLGQSVPNLNLTIQKLPESLKPLVTIFAPRAKTLPAQMVIGGTLGRPQVK